MLSQPSLFDDARGMQQLHGDAEGGIRYFPGIVAEGIAEAWFDALHANMPWHTERREMYERIVDVPRMMASMALHGADCPLALRDAHAAVYRVVDAPFTHAGLNFYRDGNDSVALHGDKLHQLVARQPIAILSLGHPRCMQIRCRRTRASTRIELLPGSVLVMSHASQTTHEHGIAKTRHPCGPRISVAFRVRPDA